MSAESRESQAVKDSKAAICVAAQLLLCQLSEKVKPGDPCCSGEMTVLIFQLGKPSYWSTITRSSKLAYAGFCFHNGDLVPGAECILLFPDWGLHYSYRNQQVRLFRFQHFDSLTVSTSALVSWMSLSCEGNGLWLWWMVGEGKRKGLGRQDLDDSVWAWQRHYFVSPLVCHAILDILHLNPVQWHIRLCPWLRCWIWASFVRGRDMAREGQRPRQRSRQRSGQRPPTQSQGSTFPCQKRKLGYI